MREKDEKDIKRDIGKGMSDSGRDRERRPDQSDDPMRRASEREDPDQEWDRDRPIPAGDESDLDDR